MSRLPKVQTWDFNGEMESGSGIIITYQYVGRSGDELDVVLWVSDTLSFVSLEWWGQGWGGGAAGDHTTRSAIWLILGIGQSEAGRACLVPNAGTEKNSLIETDTQYFLAHLYTEH